MGQYSEARVWSFKSTKLLSGARQFGGLRGFSVKAAKEGADHVFTSERRAEGFTEGNIILTGTAKFLGAYARDFLGTNRRPLHTLHTFTCLALTQKFREVVTVEDLCFDEFEFNLEGTDAIEVAMPFKCLNLLIGGKSVVPEEDEIDE